MEYLTEAPNETWAFEVQDGENKLRKSDAIRKVAKEHAILSEHLEASVVFEGSETQNALITVALVPNK